MTTLGGGHSSSWWPGSSSGMALRRTFRIGLRLVWFATPPSQGFTNLLMMVDRITRWPEAVPLASTTTSDVARAFIGTWVSQFGPPSDVSSDRGPQSTSELRNVVARGLGVRLHRTTTYPQANGLCERFHRSWKAALWASLKDDGWVDRLPWVMLGIRTAPKEDLQASSELVYGQPLRVPGNFIPTATAPWLMAQEQTTLQDPGFLAGAHLAARPPEDLCATQPADGGVCVHPP